MNLQAATQLLSPKQIVSIAESARTRIAIWTGAVRSGKTLASLLAFLIALARAPEQGLIVIVGRTLQTIERNVLEPLQDPALFGAVADHVQHTRGASTATILGRTVHLIGASDARAEGRLRGLTAYLAYVDEATLVPEAFFAQLLARLSVPGAQCLATTNPDSPAHWLRAHYLQRAHELDLRSWHFTLDDNPALDGRYVAALKSEYVGLWYRRFILGEWCLAEGSVYDMWDTERHVIDELPTITRWLAVGIDYGTVNPLHAVLVGVGADRRLYVVSEYRYDSKLSRRQKSDVEHVADIQHWLENVQIPGTDLLGVQPEYLIVDPSAASFRVQLYQTSLPSTAGDNSVLDGIRTVSSLLATDQLRVHASCAGLIDEIPGYSWDEKAAERGEDAPIKVADHGCLVAGTPVLSRHGWQPIEHIQPGEHVMTRHGWRPVTHAGMTSASAQVYEVTTTDGHILTGTGNHPLWVPGSGWRRIDELHTGDRLLTWHNTSTSLSSTEQSFAATPITPTGLSAPTTLPVLAIDNVARNAFTKKFGWPTTGAAFLQGITSTTWTAIRSTTTSKTSNASLASTTTNATQSHAAACVLQKHASISLAFAPCCRMASLRRRQRLAQGTRNRGMGEAHPAATHL